MSAGASFKRGALAAFFAANAIALVNSVMTTHVLYRDEVKGISGEPTTFEMALIAPFMTGAQWILGAKERDKNIFDGAPVSFIADKSEQALPSIVNKTVGVAFATVTAPGAWAGTIVGMTTGIGTKYGRGIAAAVQERTTPGLSNSP